jgi:predicted 3-demethylubiquinone-9 3-methyltransferase (glyoxalase superfamily)
MFDDKAEEAVHLMAYPFSKKLAWVADKYGVSWQLNLERS